MLQIITGKFFRDVELYTTRQRGILYTNYRMLLDPFETVSGSLIPTERWKEIASVIYEVGQRLEAVTLDGRPEGMIAVHAEPLIQDFSAVVSFVLGVICTPDQDLTHRLTQAKHPALGVPYVPSKYVRRTFDQSVDWQSGDGERLAQFLKDLTGLERRFYEAAIRAIRRYVVGLHRVGDDLETAYMMFVAAIESLAQGFDRFTPTWEDYNHARRSRIDKALDAVEDAQANRVREAIVAGEHLALKRRFKEFALAHLSPSFFRSEAITEEKPARRSELPAALDRAYDFRSRAVHSLIELPRQITMLPDHRDIYLVDDLPTLSIQGMSRVARHVIFQFVARNPKVEKESWDYRPSLPNIVTARLSERHWLWRRDGYRPNRSREYLTGFLTELTGVLTERPGAGFTDIRGILEEIELQIRGLASGEQRLPMLALYILFHATFASELHRDKAKQIFDRYADDLCLNRPEALLVFVMGCVEGFRWNAEDIREAWAGYIKQRDREGSLRFGALLEAATLLTWAEVSRDEYDFKTMRLLVSQAVEELPGYRALNDFEEALLGIGDAEVKPIVWRTILLDNSRGQSQDEHSTNTG